MNESDDKKQRASDRLVKDLSVFCKAGDRKGVGASCDVTEKGMSFKTNLQLNVGERVDLRVVPRDEIFSISIEGTVRHMEPLDDDNYEYKVGVEFIEGMKDFAPTKLVGDKEGITGRKSVIISGSPQDCYDAICNFDSYPSWQKTVLEVNVLERDVDSRPVLVEFFFDFIFKKVRVVNQYEYSDEEFTLNWRTVEGNIKAHEGTYVFQGLKDGTTNAIVSGFIVLGFYAPKMVMDYLSKNTMRKSVLTLKEVVESGKLKK